MTRPSSDVSQSGVRRKPLRVVVTAPGIFAGKHGRVLRRAPGYDNPRRYTILLDDGSKVLLKKEEMTGETTPPAPPLARTDEGSGRPPLRGRSISSPD